MKKHILFSLQIFFLACLLVSCASKFDSGCSGWGPNLTLFGVGLAEIGESENIRNKNQALQSATQRAYRDISAQIISIIEAGAKDYTQGDINFFETISVLVSQNIVQNARVEKSEARGKMHYVLISYKKTDAYNIIEAAAQSFYSSSAKEAAEEAL